MRENSCAVVRSSNGSTEKSSEKVWWKRKKCVPLHPQSVYCAGSYAINALKKSNLTFNCEEVGAIFLSVFLCKGK